MSVLANKIEFGDCRTTMRRWKEHGIKAQTCVTSPPYYGLRDYGHEGQIGLEQTPQEYIDAMVEVFRCVRDVLADDGTLWLNIGDSYARAGGWSDNSGLDGLKRGESGRAKSNMTGEAGASQKLPPGLKQKDLIGIPWMLAFALRADGWYLRQDIIWHKPNPMPESVRDRCTKAHEYIFLLSKSERYFFDSEAMQEPATGRDPGNVTPHKHAGERFAETKTNLASVGARETRNRRSVWSVATRPYKGAHFATFPPALIEPCILAGCRANDIVLDPFMGSGTTAAVSVQHGRRYLGCELNPEYGPLQQERISHA